MTNGAFEETACCVKGCGEIIVTHTDIEKRRQRTGETFYCPAGHGQSYIVGKTKEQKRIEQLERSITHYEDILAERMQDLDEALICPWRGCPRRDAGYVYATADTRDAHMAREHGLPLEERKAIGPGDVAA